MLMPQRYSFVCVFLEVHEGQGERISRAQGRAPIGSGSSGTPQRIEREKAGVRGATAVFKKSLSLVKQNWHRAGRAVQNRGNEFHELLRSS